MLFMYIYVRVCLNEVGIWLLLLRRRSYLSVFISCISHFCSSLGMFFFSLVALSASAAAQVAANALERYDSCCNPTGHFIHLHFLVRLLKNKNILGTKWLPGGEASMRQNNPRLSCVATQMKVCARAAYVTLTSCNQQ